MKLSEKKNIDLLIQFERNYKEDMEKIKLRKINFSKKMLENLGMLGTLLESAGINKDGLPEEMDVWVDPEKVVATSEVITLENKDYPPAFKIYFSAKEDDSWDIKGDCFDEWMKVFNPKKLKSVD